MLLRWSLLLAIAAALLAAAPGTAGDQTRIKSYCSPSGDVCYGIFKGSGGLYRFQLTLAAKYFARYRICVRKTGQQATCKGFPVRKTGSSFGGSVIWQRNFPVNGPGTYRVTWLQGKRRLGPAMTLNLPAPAA